MTASKDQDGPFRVVCYMRVARDPATVHNLISAQRESCIRLAEKFGSIVDIYLEPAQHRWDQLRGREGPRHDSGEESTE